MENSKLKPKITKNTKFFRFYFLDFILSRKANGFTLIETLVAITILSAAVAGPMVLSIKNIGTASVSQDQLVAFYLGQEVFEYARNIRDTNILRIASGENISWLDGLANCETAYGCSVDLYNSNTGVETGYSANATTLDEYTKILFPFDADTQFTDKSGNNNSVSSKTGEVYVSTNKKNFGDGSAYFDGSGDRLYISNNSDLNFSSDKFTIDFWLNFDDFTDLSPMQIIFQKWQDGNNFIRLYKSFNGALVFQVFKSGSQIVQYYSSKNDFYNVNGWHHYAVVRNGSDFKIFLDGASLTLNVYGGLVIGSHNIATGGDFMIGGGSAYKGYMDEFRFNNSIARWTSNFTVSASSYLDFLSDTDNSDGIMAKTISKNAINLSWTSLGANASYTISRGTDGVNYSQIYSTEGASYSDTGLSPDTRYYYKITAVNVSYGSNELPTQTCENSGCPNLNFNEISKKYNYAFESGDNKKTIFNRNVKITKIGDGDEAKISVSVKWTGKYGEKAMNLQDNIFNWR